MSFFKNNHRGADPVEEKPVPVIYRRTLIVSFAGLIVLSVFLASVTVYIFPQSKSAVTIGRVLPIPIVFVSVTDFITSRAFEANVDSVKRFYDKNQNALHDAGVAMNFDGPDGSKMLLLKRQDILGKMIEDALVMKIGRARGIRVTDADLAQNVDRKLQEYGTREDVVKSLAENYGWTLDDFKQTIVLPSLYSEELQKQFEAEPGQDIEAKKKINQAEAELDGGKPFESVAKEYSDGVTASNGGDLGWLSADVIAPELIQAIQSQPIRAPTSVLESGLGFHIILVEEKKTEENIQLFRLKQIFVPKKPFFEWLVDKEQAYRVTIPLRGVFWNRDAGIIQSSDPNVREFEEKIRKQPNGIFF